jgi:16S rRNA (cytidine1402-2'-O)-methyltransferase
VANASSESAGILYVIATPIGNLSDLSARAAQILNSVDLVASEDTRRGGKLMHHLGLDKKLLSVHEHNEDSQTPRLLADLAAGRSIALISDAGTPLISDPGFHLVAAARQAGIAVVAVPGPSAVTAALSVSGLATDRFVFEGFLPRRQKQRRARLDLLATEPRTMVFFEAVHRIQVTVSDMAEVFGGERQATLARELTKLHEQVVTGSLAELAAALDSDVPLLGEFVLVVAGASFATDVDDAEVRRIYQLLNEDLPSARAVALCARISGRSRNEVYALTRA